MGCWLGHSSHQVHMKPSYLTNPSEVKDLESDPGLPVEEKQGPIESDARFTQLSPWNFLLSRTHFSRVKIKQKCLGTTMDLRAIFESIAPITTLQYSWWPITSFYRLNYHYSETPLLWEASTWRQITPLPFEKNFSGAVEVFLICTDNSAWIFLSPAVWCWTSPGYYQVIDRALSRDHATPCENDPTGKSPFVCLMGYRLFTNQFSSFHFAR